MAMLPWGDFVMDIANSLYVEPRRRKLVNLKQGPGSNFLVKDHFDQRKIFAGQ